MNRHIHTSSTRSTGFVSPLVLGILVFVGILSLLPKSSESATKSAWEDAVFGKFFPGARIELESPGKSGALEQCNRQNAQVISEGPVGYFRVKCGIAQDQVVRVRAWTPARIAIRRIQSGEHLSEDQFRKLEVDVSHGQFRPYRESLMSSQISELDHYQSSQTIVEGSPLLASAVKSIPDLKRGDGVRLSVVTGDIHLTLQGVAAEDGKLGEKVRVYTEKSRRELVGKLAEKGLVEVSL